MQLSGVDSNSWATLQEGSGNDANMGAVVFADSLMALIPTNASIDGVPCGTAFSNWYDS